ncbi:MAG: hypothetical protein ACOH2A_09375 [Sphingobacteriaceae bacterium]
MDVVQYIRELLRQQNEVCVPGLGNFFKRRIDGYFNDKEGQFYPPTHILGFEVTEKEDASLVNFISIKKHISLASARYFIEKFVRTVKSQAETGISDDIELLGNMYYLDSQLIFDPIQRDEINAVYYGFSPLRISGYVYSAPEQVVTNTFVYPQIGAESADLSPELKTEMYSRGISIWLKIFFSLVIIGLAAAIVYQYNPLLFDKLRTRAFVKQIIDTDILRTSAVTHLKIDSSQLKPLNQPIVSSQAGKTLIDPVTNSTSPMPFEILGGAFPKQIDAEKAIKIYEDNGLSARILSDAPGRLFKVTLGSFQQESDAIRRRDSIVKSTNIKLKDIYIQRYKQKD